PVVVLADADPCRSHVNTMVARGLGAVRTCSGDVQAPGGTVVGPMTSQLTHWIVVHALLAVFVLMALDAVVPAGGELVMLFAGALAAGAIAGHSGHSLAAVIATGTIGCLAGSLAGWGIGRAGGRAFIERRGRWLHIGTERFERAERWFDRF